MRKAAALLALVLGVLLAGAAVASAPTTITLDGVGGVRPGMTPERVSSHWGVRIVLDSAVASPGCRTAPIRAGSVRGYALFERGRFSAAFFTAGVRTPSGIHVGSTVPQLVRAYGFRLRASPHKYEPGGQYFFLARAASPHWRIRFDSNAAARITQIGFGNAAVGYVEGCA